MKKLLLFVLPFVECEDAIQPEDCLEVVCDDAAVN